MNLEELKEFVNLVTQVVFPLKAGLSQVGATCDTLIMLGIPRLWRGIPNLLLKFPNDIIK